MEENIIGNNSHGFQNEIEIVNELKNKKYKDLNRNLKKFTKYIADDNNFYIDEDTNIDSEYEKNAKYKQDLYVFEESERYGVSCKIGSGNSVHQEKCEDFINYIKSNFGTNDEVCDDIRFFLWADGTLDGSGSLDKDEEGNIISRFTTKQFKERYPLKANRIQAFLDEHREQLIRRFLFIGRHNSVVDYIYHGNAQKGDWVSAEELVKYNMEHEIDNLLHVGKMSLQTWNASIKGTSENKRGQLQVKYSQLQNDIEYLMKLKKS